MKTLFNRFRSVNILGLFAILFIAVATLAFTPEQMDRSNQEAYGKLSNGDWVPLNGASPGTGSGEYTCEFSEDPVCTAFFDNQPDPTDEPRPQDIIDEDGVYTL